MTQYLAWIVVIDAQISGQANGTIIRNDSCTVTIAFFKNLADVVRRADIVVAAVGRLRWCRVIGLKKVPL